MTLSTANPPSASTAPEPGGANRARPSRRTTATAYVALGWVVLFFAFHIYWYLGGSFASPGTLPPMSPRTNHLESAAGMHAFVAWTINTIVDAAWPLGALVCLVVARGWSRGRLVPAVQGLVWVGCVLLVVRGGAGLVDDVARSTGLLTNGITGLSLQATTGHAHLRWSDWAIDSWFLFGGIIFSGLAVSNRPRRARSVRRRAMASRTAASERPVPVPAPRWATRLAHVIPLLVLPSGLWRLAVAFGFPMGMLDGSGHVEVLRGWSAVYVAVISLLTEAVAATAFGLVQPLGEEVPRWVPYVGGRAVRPRSVVIAATAGSVALMLIWTAGFWTVWTTGRPGPMASSFWAGVFTGCYAPLNLWGPVLLVLTWSFRRRAAASARAVRGGRGHRGLSPGSWWIRA